MMSGMRLARVKFVESLMTIRQLRESPAKTGCTQTDAAAAADNPANFRRVIFRDMMMPSNRFLFRIAHCKTIAISIIYHARYCNFNHYVRFWRARREEYLHSES